MELFIVYSTMAIVLFFCGAHRKYLMSPWVISIAIWTICLSSYGYQDLMNTILTWHFYTPFIIWISIFCISAKTAFLLTPGNRFNESLKCLSISQSAYKILLWSVILCLPFYVYRYIGELIQNGLSMDFIFGLRNNAMRFEGELGIFRLLPSLAKALLIIVMYAYPKLGNGPLWISIIANFIISLVLMEKGSILFIAVIVLYFLLKKKKISLKRVTIIGVILLGLLFIMNVVRSGITGDSNFADFLALYVASPPVAFEYIQPDSTPQWGGYSLRFFYAFASVFDGSIHPLSNQMEAVYLPYHANVYTVLQPFYQDFGLIGVAIFACIIGLTMGFLYKKSVCSQNLVYQGMYAYYIVIMVNQYFQDQFMLSLSVALQLLIIFILISKPNVKSHRHSTTFSIQRT